MKIGFDGKRAARNFTGLGNYSRYVIGLLSKVYRQNHYSVYVQKQPAQDFTLPDVEYRSPAGTLPGVYWRSYGIVKDLLRHQIDLFHGLSNEIPFGLKRAGIASVVTIHDLIFMRYPHYYPLIDRIIYKFKVSYAVKHADGIIAISQQTKRDLISYFGVRADDITVIYQDCDTKFQMKASEQKRSAVRGKYNLPQKYLLSVGTIEERKNLMVLVKALPAIPDIHLVVVGRETPYAITVKKFIDDHQLQGRVHFLKDVRHEDLPAIYQLAEVFIYPSRFEGFGIPIVEALHSEVPVIAAQGSCLEEAGGPDSIYIDPDNSHDLAMQVNTLLQSEETRESMILAGKQYVQNFGDEKIARDIFQLYKTALKHA